MPSWLGRVAKWYINWKTKFLIAKLCLLTSDLCPPGHWLLRHLNYESLPPLALPPWAGGTARQPATPAAAQRPAPQAPAACHGAAAQRPRNCRAAGGHRPPARGPRPPCRRSRSPEAAPGSGLRPPADLGFRLFGALDFGEPSTEGMPNGTTGGTETRDREEWSERTEQAGGSLPIGDLWAVICGPKLAW